MGSSDTEANRLTSYIEIENTAYANLRTHPSPAIEKIDVHPTKKKLSHSTSSNSSSPDSPLDDPFLEDEDKSSSSSASSPKHDPDRNPVFETSVPKPEPSSDVSQPKVIQTSAKNSTTEAPPTQVMERPKSTYRIPSSVFARSKSNAPMEWSAASNESLFSIQMGNMSFTNDALIWRGEELGFPGGDQASTSGQMFSYPGGNGIAAERRSHELGIAEATMKEVIRESENQKHDNSISEGRISHRSDGSNTSTKSFAFPLLAADMEKGGSMSIASPVKGGREQPKPRTPPMKKPVPQTKAILEPKSPAATGNVAQSKWFSCFPCCSLCL